jgi:hypothetical protein
MEEHSHIASQGLLFCLAKALSMKTEVKQSKAGIKYSCVAATFVIALILLAPGAAYGQVATTINLGTQARNPDFSSLPVTRPLTVGGSLPASCVVGQLFFNSSVPAGTNVFGCTATNTWSDIGVATLGLPLSLANGGTGTPTPGLIAGSNTTITGTWPNQTVSSTGSGSGSTGNAVTIQGSAVLTTPPANNQTLLYQSSNSSYVPTTIYTLQNGLGTTAAGTSNLQVNVSMGVRAVTATSDTIQAADCGGLDTYNSTSAVSVALPQPALGGNFVAGCPLLVRNYGAGSVTVTPANSTVGGSANQTIVQGHFCQFVSDGANWQLGACN